MRSLKWVVLVLALLLSGCASGPTWNESFEDTVDEAIGEPDSMKLEAALKSVGRCEVRYLIDPKAPLQTGSRLVMNTSDPESIRSILWALRDDRSVAARTSDRNGVKRWRVQFSDRADRVFGLYVVLDAGDDVTLRVFQGSQASVWPATHLATALEQLGLTARVAAMNSKKGP
ncbi:MAG TPA: hypothetical protein VL332_07495 [Candidatus Saccharimonadaceae bacterium]|jgi:hypothetical protein|nr:hypothetical protein [Candidatus Saccharimonadaceae bacterium]